MTVTETPENVSTQTVPNSAEVVIIGGGVIGASTAFHLAEAGVTDVVVLEKNQLAAGSTALSAGGFRLQFSDEINIALAQRSIAAFENFAVRPGGEIDLHQVGYLFLLDNPADVAVFERNVALQNSMGVPSRMITPAEAAELSPLADMTGILAASFCPKDGHCSPEGVVQGYALAARELGARVMQFCGVTGIEHANGTISAVHTAKGTIQTSTVICAAGPWAYQIGEMVGFELPVSPVSRPIWYTEPMASRPVSVPMTIDFSTGFYFHSEGEGLLFGMADTQQAPGFDAPTRADWLEQTAEVVAVRAPALLEVGVAGGWNGFYETTPDHNALIGEAASVSRFLYATGFSGHGFQLGPAVGEVMRDLVMGRTPSIDVSGFAVERFANGTSRPEHNVV
jgi:sarcosine oxidase, subunit beta